MDDDIEDPVAAALEMKSAGQASRAAQVSAKAATRTKPAKKVQTNSGTPLGQPEPKTKAASHPEFNRLSFVFRQAIESRNLVTAEQTFHRISQLRLTSGLSDRVMFQYVALLGSHKKTNETLRPLALIANRNGPLADEARLRIAMIQLLALCCWPLSSRRKDQRYRCGGLMKTEPTVLAAHCPKQRLPTDRARG